VNEAYLRLAGQREMRWQNRAHFFGIAAQLMRRIMIDHARRHQYLKRGGGARKVALEDAADLAIADEKSGELIALDEALSELAQFDPRKARVVELRFFGGLTVEESAEVLQVDPRTVKRDWQAARAWLYARVCGGGANEA
jgi:RNA polymerase sigma factor (TIGR02999 family)